MTEEIRKSKEQNRYIEYLQHFGLTRQEALIYTELLLRGKQTGYEIAKVTGISRSNAYSALSSLREKGAAYLVEESAKKYIPLEIKEFCGNCIRRMHAEMDWMLLHLPQRKQEDEGYITIEGEQNIKDKVKNLISQAGERVYLSCTAACAEQFRNELLQLAVQHKKAVLLTDRPVVMEGVQVYETAAKENQIGLIIDSKFVLSGELGGGNTCLYSGQKNFVEVFKTAMANEIKLIKLQKGESVQ